jgi:hypothetical protein
VACPVYPLSTTRGGNQPNHAGPHSLVMLTSFTSSTHGPPHNLHFPQLYFLPPARLTPGFFVQQGIRVGVDLFSMMTIPIDSIFHNVPIANKDGICQSWKIRSQGKSSRLRLRFNANGLGIEAGSWVYAIWIRTRLDDSRSR